MRSILFSIFAALLVGCATKPDPIDRLVAKLSPPHPSGKPYVSFGWDSGIFPVLGLPQTASTDELVSKALHMNGNSQVTDYEILKIREVHEEHGNLPNRYTAVLIQTKFGQKIVLLKYVNQAVGWWSRVYDVEPAA
jgi:hypothetical protein